VTLSIAGLPNGVTASFSPEPTAATSVLTLTASSSLPPDRAARRSPASPGAASLTTDFLSLRRFSGTNGFDFSAPLSVALTPGASTSTTIGINDLGSLTAGEPIP